MLDKILLHITHHFQGKFGAEKCRCSVLGPLSVYPPVPYRVPIAVLLLSISHKHRRQYFIAARTQQLQPQSIISFR